MIRLMKQEDLLAVHAIESETFPTPWSYDAFKEELVNDKACYLVMEEEGKLIGYGGFWKILDEGHVTNIAIQEAYRGRGLGKRLIKAMMTTAKDMNIQRVTLEVRESNEIALKVYTTLGFYIEGKRSRYYTNPSEDALIMWASLK